MPASPAQRQCCLLMVPSSPVGPVPVSGVTDIRVLLVVVDQRAVGDLKRINKERRNRVVQITTAATKLIVLNRSSLVTCCDAVDRAGSRLYRSK
jgi:hypothetical protein